MDGRQSIDVILSVNAWSPAQVGTMAADGFSQTSKGLI
jgi:hypothetical protein